MPSNALHSRTVARAWTLLGSSINPKPEKARHSQSPDHIAAGPAIWRPDPYQNWTFTSEQTMIYQDTPRDVRLRFQDACKKKPTPCILMISCRHLFDIHHIYHV